VSEIEDVEAIRRLTHEFAMAVDTKQLDALMDLFLPDAEFDSGMADVPVLNGRDEIAGFFTGAFDGLTYLFHMNGNHIIDLDGDTATGTVYHHATAVPVGGDVFSAYGYYADTYARTADGWRIQRRAATTLLDPG